MTIVRANTRPSVTTGKTPADHTYTHAHTHTHTHTHTMCIHIIMGIITTLVKSIKMKSNFKVKQRDVYS